tara:strand:+ start:473 stop:787 length:315 start_codon:yes stop_codon:yes gene_type:complete
MNNLKNCNLLLIAIIIIVTSCSNNNNYPNRTSTTYHHYYQPYDYWQRPSYSFHDHYYYIERDKHSDTKRDKRSSDGNIRPSNKVNRPSVDKPLKRGGKPLKRSK